MRGIGSSGTAQGRRDARWDCSDGYGTGSDTGETGQTFNYRHSSIVRSPRGSMTPSIQQETTNAYARGVVPEISPADCSGSVRADTVSTRFDSNDPSQLDSEMARFDMWENHNVDPLLEDFDYSSYMNED